MNTLPTQLAIQAAFVTMTLMSQRSQAYHYAQLYEHANVGDINQRNPEETREVRMGAGLLQEIQDEVIVGGHGNIVEPEP